jgi:membrane protease YdiL (CAAX protease family)
MAIATEAPVHAPRRAAPEPGAPYHRLGRTPRSRWWRTLLALVFLLLAAVALGTVAWLVAVGLHDPDMEGSGGSTLDQAWRLVVIGGAIGTLVPAVLLTARWCDRRAPGSVSSVTGRIRWSWLGMCMMLSFATAVLAVCVWLLVAGGAVQWSEVDMNLVAAVALVAVLAVPFQAAGEEYLFRGYLAQAAGTHLKGPWIPAVAISLLFALCHGTVGDQGVWGFADRAIFGLVTAWLVIRTGGLEAAIGLHAGFNVAYFVASAIDGSFSSFLVVEERATAADVAIDLGAVAVAAWLLLRAAEGSGLQTAWRRSTSA